MSTADPLEKKKRYEVKLSGIFPSITTPFLGDKVNLHQLEQNIRKYNELPLGGYMILGGNGEYLGLTEKETVQIVETILSNAKTGRTIVAGAGRESAEATISFIKRLAEWNIDFVSVITPFYYAKYMTEASLTAYFLKIADESPIPVLLYNSPDYAAGVEITPEMVSVLSRHENIVGMKNSSKRDISEFIRAVKAGETFYFHTGKAARACRDLLSGAVGATLSMAIFWPEACAELYRNLRQGRLNEATEWNQRIQRLSKAGLSSYGVPGVKYTMDLRGYFGGEARLPLLPLTGEEKADIKRILQTEKLIEYENSNRM
jgi:4-hydroxy-2-oxoglutarate aldolase